MNLTLSRLNLIKDIIFFFSFLLSLDMIREERGHVGWDGDK
jgi:hypothetical protein